MEFNTKNISNAEINARFEGFMVQAWNGKCHEIVRKQNGGKIYSSYGRASNAADHVRWNGKYSQYGNFVDVIAIDKKTRDVYTLAELI